MLAAAIYGSYLGSVMRMLMLAKCISGCTALESKLSALERSTHQRWPTGLGPPTLPSRDPDNQQAGTQSWTSRAAAGHTGTWHHPPMGKNQLWDPRPDRQLYREQVLLIRQAPALGVSRSLLHILASQHQYWDLPALAFRSPRLVGPKVNYTGTRHHPPGN